MTREEVAGAVARGYGTTANMHKELDADLVTGITNEVMALLQSLSQEAVREEVLVALEEAVDYALDVWMDRQFPYEQRTYVDGTFVEAMTELGKQRTALKREPNAQERIYTKADMEAACELALAGYRSKPVLDKMVDRFLAWPLPDSVCADLIATRQGPGRIGTNLLSATEARQMLEHVLKHEPNVAGPEDKGKVK